MQNSSTSASSIKDLVYKEYLHPRARVRLSLKHIRHGLTAVDATHRERAIMLRFFHGAQLNRQELSHAIDLLRKIEGTHGAEYFRPGLGGENRRLSSKHLAKHILERFHSQSDVDSEPDEDAGLSPEQIREEAHRRIKERAAEERGRTTLPPTTSSNVRSTLDSMRTALAHPLVIPNHMPLAKSALAPSRGAGLSRLSSLRATSKPTAKPIRRLPRAS